MRRKKKNNPPPISKVNLRQLRLNEMKDQYSHYSLKSNLLAGFFFLGLILIIWEIQIYEMTFIPLVVPLSIWMGTGLIITPFFKKTFNIYCFNPNSPGKTPIALHLFSNIVSFGGILVFLFMWSNQFFTDHKKRVIRAGIIEYGHFAKTSKSCGYPWFILFIQGRKKNSFSPAGPM